MKRQNNLLSLSLRYSVSVLLLFQLACLNEETPQEVFHTDIYNRFIAHAMPPVPGYPTLATNIRFLPASSEFLILNKTGEVKHFELEDQSIRLLGEFVVPDVAPAPVEIGLTGIALDPGFATNNLFYLCYSTGDNKWNRVASLLWGPDYREIENSLEVVINIDRIFPDEAQHGIYSLCFDSKANLYAAIGDALQPEYAQDPQSLLGKLIRIRPDRDSGSYLIPADTPYLDDPNVLPEIAAFGLRSPFRMTCWNDMVFVANVGDNHYEEIELYAGGKANFGWPFCEGYCPTGGYEIPVLTVSHADPSFAQQDPESTYPSQQAIGVGVVYSFGGVDPYDDLLDGYLVYFDVFQGYVRAARVLPDGRLGGDDHIFHLEGISGMDIGPDGHIYVTTLFSNTLFRVDLKP